MVGLNHEFARELLWREYPTDQRGTLLPPVLGRHRPLRPGATDADALREKLCDIPPIHRWPRASDARRPRPPRAGLATRRRRRSCSSIRGELLKKYPNAVVYAHKAEWQRPDGDIDPSKERDAGRARRRELARPAAREGQDAAVRGQGRPRHLLLRLRPRPPTRRAAAPASRHRPARLVLRDQGAARRAAVRLRHRRATGETDGDGQRPRLDRRRHRAGQPTSTPTRCPRSPYAAELGADDLEKQPQHDDDSKVVGAPVSAARWAYLLYQAPVMVAVHAAELLKTATE